MAIRLLDSFDDGLTSSRWGGSVPTPSTSYGKDGKGIRVGDSANAYISTSIPNPVVFGFNFRTISGTTNHCLIGVGDMTGDYSGLWYDSSGEQVFYRFYNGATNYKYAYSGAGSVPLNEWHFIELRVYQHTGSAGTLSWSLDGTPLTGITTGDQLFIGTSIYFGGTQYDNYGNWDIDNIYICDTTGGVNDDLLGPIRVDDLYPNGDGTTSGLMGSDGNQIANYQLVDEATPDDDTSYVYSTTEGDLDLYAANDTSGTEPIAGVISNAYARKTDGGPKFLRNIVRTNGTTYNGSSVGLAETYGIAKEVWDVNPDTSLSWTASEVDAMEIGQEVRDS